MNGTVKIASSWRYEKGPWGAEIWSYVRVEVEVECLSDFGKVLIYHKKSRRLKPVQNMFLSEYQRNFFKFLHIQNIVVNWDQKVNFLTKLKDTRWFVFDDSSVIYQTSSTKMNLYIINHRFEVSAIIIRCHDEKLTVY